MPKCTHPKGPYQGRPKGTIPLFVNLDEYTRQLLDNLTPNPRALGKTITSLIHAETARREERARYEECNASTLKKEVLSG